MCLSFAFFTGKSSSTTVGGGGTNSTQLAKVYRNSDTPMHAEFSKDVNPGFWFSPWLKTFMHLRSFVLVLRIVYPQRMISR